MLDNTKQPPAIVQLDGWHENTHPYYWSQHADLEAELFEGSLAGGHLHPSIHTEHTSGTPYSFHAFTSFVRMPCQRGAGDAPRDGPQQFAYSWRPTASSSANHHHRLWVRARAEQPASLRVGQPHHQHNNATVPSVAELAVLEGGEWAWLRLAPMVAHQAAERADMELRVTVECLAGAGYVDVDRLAFVADGVEFEPPTQA